MTNALIVIDVQESFRARPLWATTDNPDVIENVGRLVEAARAAGEPVIWVLHEEPGTGNTFDPAGGFVRVMDELKPAADEPILRKTVHNAFTGTDLQHRLVTGKVDAVTVCGLRTEQCVETTARVASDLGYDVTFAIDATATNPIPHRDAPADQSVEELLADPRTLSAAEVSARTEYALAGRFATVKTVAEIIGE
ncbi:putative isochorismatase [Actinoplanes missouriensis 431]|uniref:Putative isochorismatase n=1 Tax=Actinoplanes missouriensis (strain ATCC 14538 / DSM 43046 / CBS 188.64 / JCM 3121 / NBRC 102363 / NCIMB 12654 / NRRL B-3342 / UNCC 431) TaxID=512565 RepID=I0HFJ5_ACTM4|nr:cysteine hydrolase family protein [Actinoplanes missouriensis]BAL91782.1 putative isochorismatase [Actinoplanes missouriensis 431]